MPFDVKNPPVNKVNGLKKLPKMWQQRWVEIWNDAYYKLEEDDDEHECYRKAWNSVKKEMEKEKRKKKVASVLLKEKGIEELVFASSEEALQFLADTINKKVVLETGEKDA